VRESTGATDEQEAKRIRKTKEGKAANGEPVLSRVDRIKYEEISADLLGHCETTGERKLDEADDRFVQLTRYENGTLHRLPIIR